MREINLNVSADRTHVTVSLQPGTLEFDAEQLEGLIKALMAVRARLEPAIPQADPGIGTQVLVAEGMRWCIGPAPGAGPKGLRLGILHPGLGWLGLETEAKPLVAAIEVALRAVRQSIN